MKKLLFIVMLMVAGVAQLKANDTIVDATQFFNGQYIDICLNRYERMIITVPNGCTNYYFTVQYETYNDYPVILDGNQEEYYIVQFVGCGTTSWATVNIHFIQPNVPTETTTTLWKHQNEAVTLEAVGADSVDMYTYFWPHNGATTPTVEVTSQGNYQCLISDMCATAVRTKNVKENVEIDLATCDLESNLNMVTWQTNPAQAQYIDHVVVKRDGLQVGTANYSDGFYLDAIGSGAASRTYTVTAVATDGTECPIVSYPKETIHMSYTLGMGNTIEIGWNTPTGYDLLGYNICEWHPDGKDGNLTVIDFVGASVTSYTCSENLFNNGHVVVQGVENGKTESRLLSNRSEESIVGLGEQSSGAFEVYPNPSNGVLTVKGTGTLRVSNVLGQEIMAMEIDGKETVELSKGMYFVQLNGTVRKIVVE